MILSESDSYYPLSFFFFFFLLLRRHRRSTRLVTLFPYTTLFRSSSTPSRPPRGWDSSVRRCSTPRRVYASRSEEHTSELQSLPTTSYADFCLKKKNIKNQARVSRFYSPNDLVKPNLALT